VQCRTFKPIKDCRCLGEDQVISGQRGPDSKVFRVRLWDQNAIIAALLENYEKLDEDLRAELPLKRIWTIATPEEDEAE
jgi:hypothetical protein